jgi:hypothetical protein
VPGPPAPADDVAAQLIDALTSSADPAPQPGGDVPRGGAVLTAAPTALMRTPAGAPVAPPSTTSPRFSSAPRTVSRVPASSAGDAGGGGSSSGGSDRDSDYHELLGRLRAEQEQLGQLIPHPF